MNHSQWTRITIEWLKFLVRNVDPQDPQFWKTSESPLFCTEKDGPCWSQSRANCSSAALDSNCANLGAYGDDGMMVVIYLLRRGWLKHVKTLKFAIWIAKNYYYYIWQIVKFGTGIILVFSILLVDPIYYYCWCYHYLLLLILCLCLIWPFWSPVVFVGQQKWPFFVGKNHWLSWRLGSQVKLFKAFLASSKPKSGHLEYQPLVGGTALVPWHTGHCLALKHPFHPFFLGHSFRATFLRSAIFRWEWLRIVDRSTWRFLWCMGSPYFQK